MRRAAPLIATIGLVSAIACAAPPEEPPPKRPPGPELVMPGRDKPAASVRAADLTSLRRLVRQFDFEDPERFPTEMPRDWYRLLSATSGRPGYPDFGSIALSDGIAREGKWSLEYYQKFKRFQWTFNFYLKSGKTTKFSQPSIQFKRYHGILKPNVLHVANNYYRCRETTIVRLNGAVFDYPQRKPQHGLAFEKSLST